jgi:protein-S-isoprenylcysteine O-methyltransferase Ste14
MCCWFAFAGVFFFRKQPPSPRDKKRDRGSITGLVLQGLSFAIVWAGHRGLFTPLTANRAANIFLYLTAMVLAVSAVSLTMAAVKTLGKEWSLTARLLEGHTLATTGPYRLVRHPIYTGMLGMLLATGIAISHWLALIIAVVVFFVGTEIRVRSEERLLREAFGPDFEAYSRRVSSLIPGLY